MFFIGVVLGAGPTSAAGFAVVNAFRDLDFIRMRMSAVRQVLRTLDFRWIYAAAASRLVTSPTRHEPKERRQESPVGSSRKAGQRRSY